MITVNEIDRREQTKRFSYNIMNGQYKYMREKLPTIGDNYEDVIEFLQSELFVKRTVGILPFLYEEEKYNNPESQEKVQQNSEKLQRDIDALLADYLLVARGEDQLLKHHFSDDVMAEIEKSDGEIGFDLEGSAEDTINNFQTLAEGSLSRLSKIIAEADEALLAELEIEKRSELGKKIINKVSGIEKEFINGVKRENSKMFNNFADLMATLKKYIKYFLISAKALSMVKPKEETIITAEPAVEATSSLQSYITDLVQSPQEVVSIDELGATFNSVSVLEAIDNKNLTGSRNDSYLENVGRKAL